MNSAAWRARANWTRSPSATNVSSVRVISTRYLPVFSILSRSSEENSSTMVFSISPLAALVPLSMPPWPGSITTSGRESPFTLVSGGVCGFVPSGARGSRRNAAHERLTVGCGEVKHEARGLIIGGTAHEGHVDLRRAREIDDHARAALHDEAEAGCFDP